jgi:hypothetical protein
LALSRFGGRPPRFHFDFRHWQKIPFFVRVFTDKNSTASNSTVSAGRRGFPTGSATVAAIHFDRRANSPLALALLFD